MKKTCKIAFAVFAFAIFFFPSTSFAAISRSALSVFPAGVTQNAPQAAAFSANTVHVDKFLELLKKTNKPENFSRIESVVKQQIATTTDLMDLFLKQATLKGIVQETKKISLSGNPIVSFITSIFKPQKLYAGTGLPFGGPLVFTFYCACSNSWLLTIGPTSNPATSDMVLSYITGSQAFGSYNIPLTLHLKGLFLTAVPACLVPIPYGCMEIEAEGTITPIVGSSPI